MTSRVCTMPPAFVLNVPSHFIQFEHHPSQASTICLKCHTCLVSHGPCKDHGKWWRRQGLNPDRICNLLADTWGQSGQDLSNFLGVASARIWTNFGKL